MTTMDPVSLVVEAAQSRPAPGPARAPTETDLSLLLDVGSAWTKAALVGRAGGRWRIISGTAQPTAWGESALVEDLVGRLSPHADTRLSRRLASLVQEAPRITSRSARRPGRVAVLADTQAGLDAASRLAVRHGWTLVAGLTAQDRRPEPERFEALRAAEPDAWLAVAATDAHPAHRPMWGMLAAARHTADAPVLVVGPESVREPFAALFGSAAHWVAPTVDAPVGDELLALLAEVNGLPDARLLAQSAFTRSMAALSRGIGLRILGVDLGATWLAWGDPDGAGHAILAAGQERSLPDGSRTATEVLPADVDEFAMTDAMANLSANPSAIPSSPAELAIAHAMGIDRLTAARQAMGGTPAVDVVVGGGRLLAAAPHPADAALVLLDGLRPPGVAQLALDPWGICGPLGTLAGDEVDEGMETLRDDLLVPLGTAVVARGERAGQLAFKAKLHRAGWPDSPRVDVRSGSLAVIPLERGGAGELELELEKGVEVGDAHKARRLRVAVTGGAVGVILDARDDPIQLPTRPGDARTMIQSWRDALRREGRLVSG